MPPPAWLVALAVGAAPEPASVATAAPAEGCPEARALRQQGALALAEAAAARCVAAHPADAQAVLELSRALGHLERFDAALAAIDKGLDLHPEDVDMALWRVRVLAWSGAVARAREAMTAVLDARPEVTADRETAMLVADLCYWSRDWQAAAEWLSRYLASYPEDADAYRKRGLARLASGETIAARVDLERGCRLAGAGAPSCADLSALEHRPSVVEITLEGTGGTSERGDELRTSLGVIVHPSARSSVGIASELRLIDRAAGAGPLEHDVIVTASGGLRDTAWAIEGAVGAGVDATFSPRWSAWIEPAAALARTVWMKLKAWRVSYADAGATVLAPGLALGLGPVELDLRYHLALQDAGSPTHAGVALARWGGDDLWAQAGGGGGTGTDYLALSSSGGADHGHWLALAGLGWRPARGHELRLGYTLRTEWSAGASAVHRHELGLGWRFGL